MVQDSRRKEFLAMMFKDAMKPYEYPREEWNEDEKGVSSRIHAAYRV